MKKRRIVLTGAAGYLAGRMLTQLAERYELVLLDRKTENREGHEVPGVEVVDLVARDRDNYRQYFRGADAVVHCGFKREPDPNAYWGEADNINMAYNVYHTCVEENVKRVVCFSSNHATDFYERLLWKDKVGYITPDLPPLSDNFYGWAKGAYEGLGFVFSTGEIDGVKLEVVQLRIGGPRETDIDNFLTRNAGLGGDLKSLHRALGAYLSVRDQVQLVVKSLETVNIENEHGIPFQAFYGVSGNSHNFWCLANARKVIGYAPEDNSQIRFADKLSSILQAAQAEADSP